MTLAEQNFFDYRGKAQHHSSTNGWQLCCQWKDGSTPWEKLYDFKNCYPVHNSVYTNAQGIDNET